MWNTLSIDSSNILLLKSNIFVLQWAQWHRGSRRNHSRFIWIYLLCLSHRLFTFPTDYICTYIKWSHILYSCVHTGQMNWSFGLSCTWSLKWKIKKKEWVRYIRWHFSLFKILKWLLKTTLNILFPFVNLLTVAVTWASPMILVKRYIYYYVRYHIYTHVSALYRWHFWVTLSRRLEQINPQLNKR